MFIDHVVNVPYFLPIFSCWCVPYMRNSFTMLNSFFPPLDCYRLAVLPRRNFNFIKTLIAFVSVCFSFALPALCAISICACRIYNTLKGLNLTKEIKLLLNSFYNWLVTDLKVNYLANQIAFHSGLTCVIVLGGHLMFWISSRNLHILI